MKKILAFCCAAAALAASSAAEDDGQTAIHIAGPALAEYESMHAILDSSSSYLAKAVQCGALKYPGESATLDNLLTVLYTPLVTNAKKDVRNTASAGPMADSGTKTVRELKTVCEWLNDGTYIRTRFVAQYMKQCDFVKRSFRVKAAIRRLEHKKLSERLREFDRAYGEYEQLLGDWERGKGSGISAEELLMVSKLDRFIGIGGVKYSFERDAEIVDGLLEVLAEDELKRLRDDTLELARIISEARAALAGDSATFKDACSTLYGPDREKIAGLLANCDMFLDCAKEAADDAAESIAKAGNTGGETGKLRSMEGLLENESLVAPSAGGPDSNGVQNYARRLRAAHADCKKTFNRISKRFNNPPVEWK